MKRIIKTAAAPLVLAIFTFGACTSDFAGRDLDSIKVDAPDTQNKIALQEDPLLLDECGYDKRKTMGLVKDRVAHIELMDRKEQLYIISIPEEGIRYHACNLPTEFLRSGTMVQFTGEIKEIFANERWIATPFKIQDIKRIDSEFIIRNETEM